MEDYPFAAYSLYQNEMKILNDSKAQIGLKFDDAFLAITSLFYCRCPLIK